MAVLKENFISHAVDEESNAKVNPIDNNKTIIVDQYNNEVVNYNPELFEEPKNLKDVFDHFKPKVEVDFTDEDGGTVGETLQFNSIKDFEADGGKGNLVANSPFLSELKMKVDVNAKIRKQIEQNVKLREIIKDPKTKGELIEIIQSMIDELNNK